MLLEGMVKVRGADAEGRVKKLISMHLQIDCLDLKRDPCVDGICKEVKKVFRLAKILYAHADITCASLK